MRKITRYAQSIEEEAVQPVQPKPIAPPEAKEEAPKELAPTDSTAPTEQDKQKAKEKAMEILKSPDFLNTLKEKVKNQLPDLFESIFMGGTMNAADVLPDKKNSAAIVERSPEFQKLLEETALETGQEHLATTASNGKQVKTAFWGFLIKMVLLELLPSLLSGLGSVLKWLLIAGVGIWAGVAIKNALGNADEEVGDPTKPAGKKAKDWTSLEGIKEGIKGIGGRLGVAWDLLTGDIEGVLKSDTVKDIAKDYVPEGLMNLIPKGSNSQRVKTASAQEKLTQYTFNWLQQNKAKLGLSTAVYNDLEASKDLPEMIGKIEAHQKRIEKDLQPQLKGQKIQDIKFDKLYSALPKMNINELRASTLKNTKTAQRVKSIMEKL